MRSDEGEITQLLGAWSGGHPEALDRLMPLVEGELRRIAGRLFRRESPGHTLQPTALVNESFIEFVKQRRVHLKSRAEFFAFAAMLIRRILLDHARKRRAAKRGGEALTVAIDAAIDLPERRDPDLIALDDALKDLAQVSPRQSRILELRVFGGLTVAEVAEVEKLGRRTVDHDWQHARLWLRRELNRE